MGGVSRQTLAAAFPPDRFYCLLDELPLHLVPHQARGMLRTQVDDPRVFVVNPGCELRRAQDAPAHLSGLEDIRSSFALQGTIAWVCDSGGRSFLPFWLGSELEAVLQAFPWGGPMPSWVPREKLAVLAAAGIVIPQNPAEHRFPVGNGEISAAAALFRRKGYAPLPGLIHPFHVSALRRYYRYLIRTGRIHLGDGQSPLRYVVHNDPVARFFHQQIASTLSAVAGERLKPSYVYLASYLSGAELKKHTDREQCEFSITLCLDFSPEPELATPWPIRLDTSHGTVAVYQALGDGLAYRGTRLPHYRDPLAAGQSSTSIFFHYVSEDFNGPLI